jgi:hypothetical protein
MTITDTRQSVATFAVALIVMFLFGVAEGVVAMFIVVGVLGWLIRGSKRRK